MKLLLYGGTFDPPHYGHLNNLRAAARRVQPHEVIVMPAGVPPHKQASATPSALRVEMCGCFRALAEGPEPVVPQLTVSDWEVRQAEQGCRNYSVLTLEMLAAARPGAELFLTVGSDMLLAFDAWYRWQDILRLACLVVVSREKDDDAALRKKSEELDKSGKRILFAQAEALPMSSSGIRACWARGEACEAQLPESVRAILVREGLYRQNEGD